MLTIDKNSPVPAYYQIQKVIMDRDRQWDVGSQNADPSERELAERFNVSRMTMRQALAHLNPERGPHQRDRAGQLLVAEHKSLNP